MKVWIILKDDQSYGQNIKEVHASKKSADKRKDYFNKHKDSIDAVTGDFYVKEFVICEDGEKHE